MDQKVIDRFKAQLKKAIIKEFTNQGHSLTGAFEESIDITDEKEPTTLTIKAEVNDYGKYLDRGVKSSNIPYSRGSGAGKSAYIDALTRYAMVRMGLSGKQAKSAAFAIATNHKKHGMPSPGSYQYSKNNRRTEWVDNVLAESVNMIEKFANDLSDSIIEISINNLYKN